MAVLEPAVGFLFLSVLVAGVGVCATQLSILPRAVLLMGRQGSILRAHLSWVALIPAILLPLAVVLVLVRQLGSFRDPYAPLAQDASLLLGSAWGDQWMMGMVGGLLALVGGFLIRRRQRVGWWSYSLGFLMAAGFSSLSGHAGGVQGSMKLLVLSSHFLHLLAAGIWIGSLATTLALEARWRMRTTRGEPPSILPILVPAFSPLALAGAGILGVTGILTAWVHLPEPVALWSTGYGRLLLLKLGIVMGILGLGAWNWKRVTPRLSDPRGAGAMRRSAGMELGMAALVILVTALLVRTSPAISP